MAGGVLGQSLSLKRNDYFHASLLKKKLKNSTMERLIIPIFAKIYFCLLKP
jgi:hypothetical protein